MQRYDAIVIGGGPGGASCAARLAQLGRKTLLVEKERFPRFQIGESLLPASLSLLSKIGARRAIREAGFVEKFAAEFVTFDGSKKRRYPFTEGLVNGPPSAYQVERNKFDDILLANARSHGVDVRQQTEARDLSLSGTEARATLHSTDGSDRTTVGASFIVDASGRNTLIARDNNTRHMDKTLQNFAVFTHVKGARRGDGSAAGDITIVVSPEGWWWLIPLTNDVTSVGIVAPSNVLNGARPDETYFDQRVAESTYLTDRLRDAKRVGPVRVTSNYSYRVDSLVGDRWALVGDAAGFIDPVFSSGAHLALASGVDAAEAIHDVLDFRVASRRRRAARLREYERKLVRSMDLYRGFVREWYGPSLSELLMAPTDRLSLRAAVTTLLAGYGDGNLKVRWRLGIFDALVKANSARGLVEKLPGRRAPLAAPP